MHIGDMSDLSCVSIDDLLKYANNGKARLYGWHISDLVIYAKPYFAPPENNPAERLAKVLESIEKAIDALCLRITMHRGILTIRE